MSVWGCIQNIIISATIGKDYVGLPSVLYFATGQSAGALSCINISVVDDGIAEQKENFVVELLTNFQGVHISRARSVVEINDSGNNQSMLTQ